MSRPGLPRLLLAESVRFLGASQAGALVILHGAWMLLLVATWQHAHAGSPGADVLRELVRAYVWLGGADSLGVGDETNLLAVWAKLSVAIYLLGALLRPFGGRRAPARVWVLALVSGGIALAGYGFGFLAGSGTANLGSSLAIAALLATVAALAGAWAALARRLAEAIAGKILDARAVAPPAGTRTTS